MTYCLIQKNEKNCNDCGEVIDGPYYTVDSGKVICEKDYKVSWYDIIVKLRQGSGKDWQGMAVKAKGLKA